MSFKNASKFFYVELYGNTDCIIHVDHLGEQGWRSSESTRLPPIPDSILDPGIICGLSLLLVLSLFREVVFLWDVQFSPRQKNQCAKPSVTM